MLAGLIGALQHPDMFDSIIRRLGQDHAGLGIQRQHYVSASDALICALEQSLGPRFTPDVRAAWSSLYADVQNRMLAAGTVTGPPCPA